MMIRRRCRQQPRAWAKAAASSSSSPPSSSSSSSPLMVLLVVVVMTTATTTTLPILAAAFVATTQTTKRPYGVVSWSRQQQDDHWERRTVTRRCRQLLMSRTPKTGNDGSKWRPDRSGSASRRLSTTTTTTTGVLRMSQAGSGSEKEEEQDDSLTNHSPTLMLYNSRTRSKEPLRPLQPPTFRMYTCGPTVYDYAHVGNFRAFLTYDLLKRVLMYLGYRVVHVCNLTDIDDKIIKRANQLSAASIRDITDKYANLFLQDLQALNVIPATHYPRATNHVKDMVTMIRTLRDKGLAYETIDGSWYFDTQQQETYGTQLIQLNYDDMIQEDDEENGIEKRHFADFCLWKSYKDGFDRDDAVWSYEPDIAKGRPGWHLECSAMVHHYFGTDTIDLHGGGIDLKFPHHENEIAQSQGYTDNLYCNCWFHNGFVNIDNEKMSKSLGNFRTLSEACPTALAVRSYRYLVITSQYRNPLSFTPQAMQAAQNAVMRIDKVRNQIQQVVQQQKSSRTNGDDEFTTSPTTVTTSGAVVVTRALRQFEDALLDDLAMPRASAALFMLVKEAERILKAATKDPNSSPLSKDDIQTLQDIHDAMDQMDQVFGIFYTPPSDRGDDDDDEDADSDTEVLVPEPVLALVMERAQAKADKDWARADSLRNQIAELGYQVKDVKDGEPIVSRAR